MGDVNHRPERKISESAWVVKNTFPDVYQPLNDYSGEESLLHTTSVLMYEGDYAAAERYFRLGNGPHQRLNMLQLIAHLRLLHVSEIDCGLAEPPGQA